MATLHEAYQHAKKNGGAPGIDGQSFADVEQEGVTPFLESIQAEQVYLFNALHLNPREPNHNPDHVGSLIYVHLLACYSQWTEFSKYQ